jgi:hypothetical protein
MKMGAPVDINLAALKKIAPAPQAIRRDVMRGGAMRSRHSAPRQRFDMHRPERLNGARPPRFAQRSGASATSQTTLLAQKFRCCARGLRAVDRLQPAVERRFREPMRATIFGLAEAAASPSLDVNRPPLPPGFVLEIFRRHGRNSHVRRNPICRDIALLRKRAEIGRLHAPT